MDKKTFFRELSDRLKRSGVSDENVKRQLDQFDSYFSTLSEEDYIKEMNSLSDVDKVAKNIVSILNESEEEKEPEDDLPEPNLDIFEEAHSEETNRKFPEQTEAAPETPDDLRKMRAAKRPGSTVRSASEEKPSSLPEKEEEEETEKIREDLPTKPRAKKSEENNATIFMDPVSLTKPTRKRPVPGKPIENGKEKKKPVQRTQNVSEPIRFSELDDVVPLDRKNVYIFWIVFVLALPLIAAILLAILGVFGGLFLLIAGIIAACLVGLVAIAAGGTGVSLLSIIYGFLKFSSARAESLYEIGNGILIGGIAILSGVLLYNIAVRLMPVLLKWLGKLFRYTAKKLLSLFKFIKRECTGR